MTEGSHWQVGPSGEHELLIIVLSHIWFCQRVWHQGGRDRSRRFIERWTQKCRVWFFFLPHYDFEQNYGVSWSGDGEYFDRSIWLYWQKIWKIWSPRKTFHWMVMREPPSGDECHNLFSSFL